MRNFEKLQSLLFKWLKNYGSRHINQIRSACHRLLGSYNISDKKTTKNHLYHLFYPLLRYGLVEFIGKGYFQISPPVIFLNRDGSDYQFVAINLNKVQLKELQKTIPGFKTDIFQISRFSALRSTITEFACKAQIRIQDNRIDSILSKIPTIPNTVNSFEKCHPNSNGFYHLNLDHFKWKKVKNELKPGLYKAAEEDYSLRYFRCSDNTWKRIPSMEKNPDMVNIARCAQGILENRITLSYDTNKKQLICMNINLPILLDRILRIPSYHLADGVIQINGATMYNNITMSDYRKLNRIFCNSVELI